MRPRSELSPTETCALTTRMKLIHRTNYWGQWIDPSDTDSEVPFDVIWAQAVSDHSSGCCRGFGTRAVDVLNSDFVDEDPEWWHVFLVSSQRGRTDSHFFYKLVTLPQGTYGYGRRGCAALGWSWVGEFCAGSALERLANALEPYLEEYNRSSDFHHVHLGIKMEKLYAPRR